MNFSDGCSRDWFVVTGEQQGRIDQRACAEGATTRQLMESAGSNAARLILEGSFPRRVVVLAGKGGNGGDALVLARRFIEHGIDVRVFVPCPKEGLSPETAAMASLLEAILPESLHIVGEDLSPLREAFTWGDCVIDGLVGCGIDRPLTGRYAQMVELINEAPLRTISLDLPSGLPSDRGRLVGSAIRADMTIAMAFLKPAHLLYPARSYCGSVKIAGVDYPREVLKEFSPLARVLTPCGAKALLPARRPDGHKGTFGRVLVIAGSIGMSGAAILCCRGALRAGTGLVTLAGPRALNPIFATALPEVVTLPLPDRGGHLCSSSIARLRAAFARVDVVAIGPGLSRARTVGRLVRRSLLASEVPLVLDADGLFHLAQHLDLLRRVTGRAVLTPHPGELSHIMGQSVEKIDEDRIAVAQAVASEHGVVLVLKGRPTAIGFPDGEVYLNPTGNTGLATGGSGDVLTGLIAGFMAGGASPADAAVVGTYVHGYAADWLTRTRAERAILPTDLLEALPYAIAEVERCG
jgi:NAD(P)H-hydrate epimerase